MSYQRNYYNTDISVLFSLALVNGIQLAVLWLFWVILVWGMANMSPGRHVKLGNLRA